RPPRRPIEDVEEDLPRGADVGVEAAPGRRRPRRAERGVSGKALVWIDGAPVDASEARVPVFDRGFLYGDSSYEVTRAFYGVAFALDDHLDRLERSAAGLVMRTPPRAEIRRAVVDTLRMSALPD